MPARVTADGTVQDLQRDSLRSLREAQPAHRMVWSVRQVRDRGYGFADELLRCDTTDGGFRVVLPTPDSVGVMTAVRLERGLEPVTVVGVSATIDGAAYLDIEDVGEQRVFVATSKTSWASLISVPPPADTQAWQTVLDLDLTAEASQTFPANGTTSIGGLTWTTSSGANAGTFGLLNGTGLQIYPNGNASDYENNGFTAPKVQLSVSSAFPGLSYPRHSVRVWAWSAWSGLNQNYERVWVSLEKLGGGTTSSELRMIAQRGNNYQGNRLVPLLAGAAPAFTGAFANAPAGDDVAVLTLGPSWALVQSGLFGTTWPAALTACGSLSFQTYQDFSAGLYVALGANNSAGLGNLTYDVKRLRIDVRES